MNRCQSRPQGMSIRQWLMDNGINEKSYYYWQRKFRREIGKKNWMFHNSTKGADASAVIYSISETTKLNELRPYYYFKYLLTELPKLCGEDGNIDPAKLDPLLPWSKDLPEECKKPRR